MSKNESIFSFDIGWKFHGWGVKLPDGNIDTGVYAFEHYDDYEQYAEIRRGKRRTRSKKQRLNQLKKMFVDAGLASSNKEVEAKLKKASHQNKIWLNLHQAHSKRIAPEAFMQILYRFAKRRHYVDMRKKEEATQDNAKKKEEGEIKKSLSKIAEIYENLELNKDEIKTWFSALFERREELIKTFEEHALLIDREKFPYTNASLKKILGEDIYKKIAQKITGYELLLRNDQIAESIDDIAKKQRVLGNDAPIFAHSFIEEYIKLITYKGKQPSFADKIGLCLSGTGVKRHPQSSIDAETTRIKESYFHILIETDKEKNPLHDNNGSDIEVSFSELDIDYETYYSTVFELSKANKKGEATTKKIIDTIKKQDKMLKNRYFVYKNFKYKQEHDKAIVLRLPGHRRLHDLSESFCNIFLQNDSLRDQIEFEMLCYRDPDVLKEKLKDIVLSHSAPYSEEDLELLAVSDVGKPAPCNNETYRKIQEGLEQRKNFQTALIAAYPNALVNLKHHYRRTLDYKLYLKKQKQQGINNPFQNKVIEEFIFVFNRMIQKYGEANRIVLETTRAILSESDKKKYEDTIAKNEKLNRKINDVLDEYATTRKKKPSKGARERLKLFVQQGGELKLGGKESRCILTGNPISIDAAIEGDRTNTDHIIPQTWIHDNRLENKILMDRAVNQSEKEDKTPLEYLQSIGYSLERAKEKLKENLSGIKQSDLNKLVNKGIDAKAAKKQLKEEKNIQNMNLSKTKLRHIFEERNKEKIKKDTEDRIHSMDQRMKGIQDASIKLIMELLVDQYRFNTKEKLSIAQYREKVLPVTGKMTSLFRRGWLKGYKKRRDQYYNHAVDALVMLNFDRAFLSQYVSLLQQSYLEDKNPIWIAKEKMHPTIEKFEEKVINFIEEYKEQSRVVVRRPVQKYTGRVFQQMPKSADADHAVKTKKHYFIPDSGFGKLIFYKTKRMKNRKEIDSIGILKLHPAQAIEDNITKNDNFIGEAYRNSLLYIRSKNLCGYFYLIGYSKKSNGQEPLEVIPVNFSPEKRMNPDITAKSFEFEVIKKLPINGKINKPDCKKA